MGQRRVHSTDEYFHAFSAKTSLNPRECFQVSPSVSVSLRSEAFSRSKLRLRFLAYEPAFWCRSKYDLSGWEIGVLVVKSLEVLSVLDC
ncbi:hypothetical protein TorRG33x02_031430 [Trema orientale]|uniref:Uncharacterized protein n=1 Tax=Trema orientale TaxID=63057 RepID=A0A2P5FT54_TREOI|nr:hypothetical protein TorRG33x02_031430 [Trema orientale]